VSANGTPRSAEILANAMEKVGKEGVITVEREQEEWKRSSRPSTACSSTAATSRPYFVTDTEKMTAVLNNPLILIHEKKIGAMADSFAAPRAGPQGADASS